MRIGTAGTDDSGTMAEFEHEGELAASIKQRFEPQGSCATRVTGTSDAKVATELRRAHNA